MTRDEEFRSFFAIESDRLRRLGIFLTGDADLAADLAQEALARTYRHWRRISGDAPGPYARRILVNLVRSRHRRTILQRRHEGVAIDPTTRDTPRVEEWLRVTNALKQLPPLRRAAIVLRSSDGRPSPTVANSAAADDRDRQHRTTIRTSPQCY